MKELSFEQMDKKKILSLVVVMIFSLSMIQGICQKNIEKQTLEIQQVGAGMLGLGGEMGGVEGAAVGFYGGAVLAWTANSFPVWGSMGPVGWTIGGGLAL